MTHPRDVWRRTGAVPRRRGPRAGQDGMTLVEMMIAMLIATVILAAGAAALIAATKGLDSARQNRQAADVFTEAIEQARAADYDELAVILDPAALAADTRLTTVGGEYYLDPDGAGPEVAERLVTSPTGAVAVRQDVVRDNTPYAVSSYVTEPAAADAGYRRLVTWVTWERGNRALSRQAATVVASGTGGGSARPSLTFGTDASFTVNVGATLQLPVALENAGPGERWNLATAVPGRSWSISWYEDIDGDGTWDDDETTKLGDTSGDGVVDTGALATGETTKLIGLIAVPSADAAGTATVTVTASAAGAPEVSAAVVHTVAVVAQTCNGCTYRSMYAANTTGLPADSTLLTRMALVDAAGPAVILPNYDTDRDANGGRSLVAGAPSVTDANATRVATWSRQLASATTLRGEAVVRMYVGMKALDALKTGSLRVEVGHTAANGSGWTSIGALSSTSIGFGASFALVEFRVPVAQVTIAKNRLVQLRMISPVASGPLSLAFGTTQYPARVDLPVVT